MYTILKQACCANTYPHNTDTSNKRRRGGKSPPSPGGGKASEKAVNPVAFGNKGVFKKCCECPDKQSRVGRSGGFER